MPRLPSQPFPRQLTPTQQRDVAWEVEKLFIQADVLRNSLSNPPRDESEAPK